MENLAPPEFDPRTVQPVGIRYTDYVTRPTPPALTFRNSLFCPQCVDVLAWISEQTAIISLYNINSSVFITDAVSVYCAVRAGSLTQTDTVSSLKGY